MKQYIIDETLRDNLLNYLAEQTYKNVWMGIDGLRALPELPTKEEEGKDDGEPEG